ncbi:hypothetical protein ACN42_g2170 [Penicillium freii]|uniref:Zn(2)-C6 fungal-type domain-containing protein n=1 Tax=Penicillium freii TaxID=48697 RepID=A0A117NR46_PENFR|nr:hypothetical protein ACN42_g2170 [Penicillium freii]
MADQPGHSPYSPAIEDGTLHFIPSTGKRRIPKACGACRQSKVKCDGERPCTRCQKLEKQCVFFEIPKDPVSEYEHVLRSYQPRLTSPRRIEDVESEVQHLRKQLDEMRELLQESRSHPTPKPQLTQSPTHLRDQQQHTNFQVCLWRTPQAM